ncbi:MAG: hypothetical protein CFH34_00654 [Alphaproteobacteria bacterium MarineAlpha9_Bin4]|nr:hypothetical protein [Pelagibacterales bacterium]PPR26894.1 MAG: hypothetical protein CFH34_00654 [Alphaproteobacteria bacterium MarineAlpha9_Bin4]|tara:strand:- start:4285 stop:4497 length:213 start_codon:yes stop_codon:yes gene_type:complete
MKKISDYIVTFAFLYSSFLCFDKAIDLWINNNILSIILFFCGILSFIAVFRFSIANIIYYLKRKFKNEKK